MSPALFTAMLRCLYYVFLVYTMLKFLSEALTVKCLGPDHTIHVQIHTGT